MPLSLTVIVDELGGRLLGNADLLIDSLAPLQSASAHQISFLSHARYQSQLAQSAAGCVIVSPAFESQVLSRTAAIVTEDPYLYFARLTQLWKRRHADKQGPRIHPKHDITDKVIKALNAGK